MFRITPVVKNLIIINVIMALASWLLPVIDDKLALYYFKSPNFQWWQYFTHMFMHGGFFHIFFNMYALFVFGVLLEQYWGSKRFLTFYLLVGLGAAFFYTMVNYIEYSAMEKAAHAFMNTPTPMLLKDFISNHVTNPNREIYDFINEWVKDPGNKTYIDQAVNEVNEYVKIVYNIPMVGASGAVFGVLLAFGMMFPNLELMLLFPPIPIKAKYFVLIYGAIELYLGFSRPGSNIAHFAHLGGMLFGFILIKLWQKRQ